MANVSPQAKSMLRWFDSSHLHESLQDLVIPIEKLANDMAFIIEEGPELTAGLRKLLEAKDCFVRAAIERDEQVEREQAEEEDFLCVRFENPVLNRGLDEVREAVRRARGGDAPTQTQGFA